VKTKWIDKKMRYDGSQLQSHFALTSTGIQGPSVVAFSGPCHVSLESMVDYEDLLEKSDIKSDDMLHFIVEFFPANLVAGVALQRLLASIVADCIHDSKSFWKKSDLPLVRSGDDLYLGKKKLSISIASSSVVSTMIHFAVNITNKGTPVPTCSLNDFGISAKTLASQVLKKFAIEYASIIGATEKVRPLN